VGGRKLGCRNRVLVVGTVHVKLLVGIACVCVKVCGGELEGLDEFSRFLAYRLGGGDLGPDRGKPALFWVTVEFFGRVAFGRQVWSAQWGCQYYR